jgi:hypothetical protein
MLRQLKNILLIPALFLHELSHVFVGWVLDGNLKSYTISKHEKGHYEVKLNIRGLDQDWKLKAVAMSPILVPLTLILLSLFNINFLFVVAYLALFYKNTLPSPSDFKMAGWKCPSFLTL